MEASGSIAGERASRTKVVSRLLLACALFACGCGDATAPVAEQPTAIAFDRFWQDFDRTYPYFDYKRIDWSVGHDALRERAAAARDDSSLVAVLRDAVAPLRDVHVWFRRPDGSALASWIPTRATNWSRTVWLDYVARLDWHQGVSNWGWGRVGDIGYVAIGQWDPVQVRIEDLDAALEQLRNTRALILDVRMNGGGNDALALSLAGRFAAGSVRFGAVRYRSGPSHTDFGPWTDRILVPRGPWTYAKRVYLLVGPGCFSSNETFIAAMRELPSVTVVGDTTGGGSGNPIEIPLTVGGRVTGWKYAVPRWIEVIADGTVIEWRGIDPDVVVPWDSALVAGGVDPVLEWALAATQMTAATRRR